MAYGTKTKAAYRKLGDMRIGQEFGLSDLFPGTSKSSYRSMIVCRMLKDGLVERVRMGRYQKLAVPAPRQLDLYHQEDLPQSKAAKSASMVVTAAACVAPYVDGTCIIVIGDRTFLGTEVALTPKK
jgi:hypothetical protein